MRLNGRLATTRNGSRGMRTSAASASITSTLGQRPRSARGKPGVEFDRHHAARDPGEVGRQPAVARADIDRDVA